MSDKKAETKWEKSNISFINYQNYINNKSDRYKLTLIDLLYISNFKGGNASIHEEEQAVNKKLLPYSQMLIEINKDFADVCLSDLDNDQLQKLISKILAACELTSINSKTKIDGFSVSYLSALLSAYFPNLIPILDRRVLMGFGIVTNEHIDSQGQIKKIKQHYKTLIEFFFTELGQKKEKNIREIDRMQFIKETPKLPRK